MEEFNFDDLIKKYNTTNYVVTMMNYQNNKLNIYLKVNFNNSELTKNISYKLQNINDEISLEKILSELKRKEMFLEIRLFQKLLIAQDMADSTCF